MNRTRREFLRDSAAAAGGLAVTPVLCGEGLAAPRGLPARVLGRTKERVPIIGFGAAPLGSDNTTPEEAERILNAAIELGVTYLDTAPVYGDPKSKYGNAEMKLKTVLKTHRGHVFLVTKVNNQRPDRDGVLRQLDESLDRMGVDRIDAVHIHNLGDFDMDKVFRPDGTLGGLIEARKRGLIRFIGTSGHMRPARFARAFETGEIDLTMNALNFADRVNYDFEGEALTSARKHKVGIVAMKVLGGADKWAYDGKADGTLSSHHGRAIRYALGLPGVACAVIGFKNEEEVRRAVAVAHGFKPLSAEDRTALLAEGRKLAESRGLYYGPLTG